MSKNPYDDLEFTSTADQMRLFWGNFIDSNPTEIVVYTESYLSDEPILEEKRKELGEQIIDTCCATETTKEKTEYFWPTSIIAVDLIHKNQHVFLCNIYTQESYDLEIKQHKETEAAILELAKSIDDTALDMVNGSNLDYGKYFDITVNGDTIVQENFISGIKKAIDSWTDEFPLLAKLPIRIQKDA